MATVKHIAIHNSSYSAATDYLTMQYNEFTNKPVFGPDGEMLPRDFYLIDGINCDPYTFASECQDTNAFFGQNQRYEDIKAHHYIISFDPNDRDENGLTPEKAQELGLELARKAFPGHQTIVCTHRDGHNGAGNIHCHIVINSVRAKDTIPIPNQERKVDNVAGFKHRASDQFIRTFKSTVMDLCQCEGLYQVDLLSPARVRITDREYWAQRRGQAKLDQENVAKVAAGEKPTKTVYETGNAILRRQIKSVLEDSRSFDDFKQKLLGQYGILVGESRGRINYLPSNRTKPIRGRMLGADFEKEAIEAFFRLRRESLRKEETSHESKAPSTAPVRYSLIMQLQVIVDEQAKPYAAQDAKIRQLKDMAQTLAFCQENHIESREELEFLLTATHEDYMAKKEAHAITTAELKEAKEILNYTKQRHANKKVYLEFMNSKRKAKFRAEHEPEIILYEAATRELKKLLKGNPVPAEKKTIAKIRELSARKNEEYEELSEIKKREKSLQEKVNNVRSIYENRIDRIQQKNRDQELG
ncbi:MAG: relaxase/mobilization nuclease domain-containing protein [Clostridiales bacterium]|nr:relaxase/mobilization nuclease domain-containing protein [Clostridiales bacterium]